MAMQPLSTFSADQAEFDPNVISEETANLLLSEDDEPKLLGIGEDDDTISAPPFTIQSQDSALDVFAEVKAQMTSGDFMAEELEQLRAEDPDFDLSAFFDEVESEIAERGSVADLSDESLDALVSNTSGNRLFIEGETAILMLDGKEAMRFGAARMSKKDEAVFLRTVVLIIDIIFLMVALVGVGMKASKGFAERVAKLMTKTRKKWLNIGKKIITTLKKVITTYEGIKAKNAKEKDEKKKRANLLSGLKSISKQVGDGFKSVFSMLYHNAWEFIKTTIKEYINNWKKFAKLILQIGLKLAAMIGTVGAALAAAIIDALIKAITVLQDIDALKKAQAG